MGPEYTKSGRSQASVNSPQNFDATVASIKEQVRNEMREEFNAWAKQMNLPTLPFSSTTPADSSSHPRREGEQEINAREEIGTPSHANSRGLDTLTPHHFPILQVIFYLLVWIMIFVFGLCCEMVKLAVKWLSSLCCVVGVALLM
ncbi:uncharacterized protein LOC110726986 [Chenopodium quinoa]|uniref:uncharacterized protein LOC110726986 n=1 Tax=Chenopodium quinoa TaxID=63459 RepID=UPI000B7808B2|nr:uncharacterized protein LOC110726986 [Chenopodium quinoa]